MASIQVLFEYKNSKRQLTLSPANQVCEAIAQELINRFGKADAVVHLSKPSSSNAPGPSNPSSGYLLQRWSTTWQTFIDVEHVQDIEDKDRLTVVGFPSGSPQVKSSLQKAQSIVARVKKPTEAEAKALASCFPSTSARKHRLEPTFDLSADCVALPQQKKKKSTSQGRLKLTTLTVVVMKKYERAIPRGKRRQQLSSEGRVQPVKLSRSMSSLQVKNAILCAFEGVISNFTVLECDQCGHNLFRSLKQDLDGEAAIQRRGCLCLCEEYKPTDGPQSHQPGEATQDSDSDNDFVVKPKPPATAAARILKKSKSLSSPLDQPVIDLSVDSSDDSDSQANKHTRQEILASRLLREEQDLAFAKSLRIDKAKAERAREKEADRARKEELQQALRTKWIASKMSCAGGLKFILRFPNSTKVECSLPSTSFTKDLYEIAAAFGTMAPFQLYNVLPRLLIPHNMVLSELPFCPPSVLVVEERDDAPDPLQFFAESETASERCLADQSEDNAADGGEHYSNILQTVEASRCQYALDTLDTHHGLPHCIRRECLFDDVIELYKSKSEQLLGEYPFRVSYDNEKAIDTGGVCRDMFSAFWEDAYMRVFDGGSVLVPAVHAHVDMTIFPILGTILSHGFLSSGFLPIRLAFPVIAAIVHGPMVKIPEHILVKSLATYLSSYENSVIRKTLQDIRSGQLSSFSAEQAEQLVYILSQLGCREIPSPANLERLLLEVARHELLIKPLGALHALRSGVPVIHHGLWDQLSVEALFALYNALKN